MELSLRYYEPIKGETSIEKEGQVIIDSGAMPVNFKLKRYTPRGESQQRYYGYFNSNNKWTVRLHLEKEEVELLIRKLQDCLEK